MFVFKAAVVGAGTMGGQIAQTIAAAGIPVVLKDVDDDLVEAGLPRRARSPRARSRSSSSAASSTEEAADAQVDEVLGRIHGTTAYEGFGDVDFVIEAVPERMEVKRAVFADLDAVTPGHAILASNTSSLSITEIGEATQPPGQGLRLPLLLPGVGHAPGRDRRGRRHRGRDAARPPSRFAQTIRKMPITCAEVPGFVVNRILNSALSEVWRMQEEQGLSIKQIDEAVTGSKTAPMGPFQLADLLGLDTILHVAEYLDASLPAPHVRPRGPAPAGRRRQARREDRRRGLLPRRRRPTCPATAIPTRRSSPTASTSRRSSRPACSSRRACVSTKDPDLGMMAGAGLMPPPFARADATGLDESSRASRPPRSEWGERFAPPLLLRRLAHQGRLGLKAGQGVFPTSGPTPTASSRARRSRSRRAATSRSRGSTARR